MIGEAIKVLEAEVQELLLSPRGSTEYALLHAKSVGLSFLRQAEQDRVVMTLSGKCPLNERRKVLRKEVIQPAVPRAEQPALEAGGKLTNTTDSSGEGT